MPDFQRTPLRTEFKSEFLKMRNMWTLFSVLINSIMMSLTKMVMLLSHHFQSLKTHIIQLIEHMMSIILLKVNFWDQIPIFKKAAFSMIVLIIVPMKVIPICKGLIPFSRMPKLSEILLNITMLTIWVTTSMMMTLNQTHRLSKLEWSMEI